MIKASKIISFLNKDMLNGISNSWNKITLSDKKLFLSAYLINIVAYSIFITHYLMHNHATRMPWIAFSDQFHAGRWASPIFYFLTGFANIPVLQQLIAISLNILAALLALKLWSQGHKELHYFVKLLVVLLITLYPANLAAFYYTWQVNLFMGSILFCMAGLWVASSLTLPRLVSGSILITFGIGSYQASLSVLVTVFAGYLITYCLASKNIMSLSMKFLSPIAAKLIVILLGGIGYVVGLKTLIKSSSALLQPTSLADVPDRLLRIFSEAPASLIFTQPDLLGMVKTILLVIVVSCAFFLMKYCRQQKEKSLGRLVFFGALFLTGLMSTKILFLLTNSSGFSIYRYNFALGYFYAFSFLLLLILVNSNFLRNLFIALGMFATVLYFQADLIRQGVLVRGQIHDLAFVNRVIYRVESLPGIDFEKRYRLVFVGSYPKFRTHALSSMGHEYGRGGDSHMDRGQITDSWAPGTIFMNLGSMIKIRDTGYQPPRYIKLAKKIIENKGIEIKKWPHQSSVFVHDDLIIVYFN